MKTVMVKKGNQPGNSTIKCTPYTLHKSQLSIFSGIQKYVIDFTEHKLKKYLKTIEDVQQKAIVTQLILDYKKGDVAIAWMAGRPQWLKVTHEKLNITLEWYKLVE